MERATPEERALPGLPSIAADGPVSYTIMQLAKLHKAVAAGLLREIGLYPGQELLLMYLWDQDERTQAELVNALHLDASTVTRMVTRLEDHGIVRRQASPTDRRAVVVCLTPRGRELREDVRRMWSRLEASTTAGLSSQERDDLLRVLRRAARTVGGSVDGGRPAG